MHVVPQSCIQCLRRSAGSHRRREEGEAPKGVDKLQTLATRLQTRIVVHAPAVCWSTWSGPVDDLDSIYLPVNRTPSRVKYWGNSVSSNASFPESTFTDDALPFPLSTCSAAPSFAVTLRLTAWTSPMVQIATFSGPWSVV